LNLLLIEEREQRDERVHAYENLPEWLAGMDAGVKPSRIANF